MIPKKQFGSTGHESSRVLFGAVALAFTDQDEAFKTLDLIQRYGINHIDTAASYGDSEVKLGPWLKDNRDNVFLATKTEKRTYREAKEELHRSLKRLQVDSVDLWQMHILVDPEEWETAMGEKGALKAFIEAKEEGLIRFLGVTGHGVTAPWMHLKSLERYPFDSVLLPYNYAMMQNGEYREGFEKLSAKCRENGIALQAIKTLAKGPKKDPDDNTFATWYEPFYKPEEIETAVHWALNNEQIFLNSAGDVRILPHILEAASRFDKNSFDPEGMKKLAESGAVAPLFT